MTTSGRKLTSMCAAIALSMCGVQTAQADLMFTFTFSGAQGSGIGSLDTVAVPHQHGVFGVVGGNLIVTSGPDHQPAPYESYVGNTLGPYTSSGNFYSAWGMNSPSGAIFYDNVLYNPPQKSGANALAYVDIEGLLFRDPKTGIEINIYSGSPFSSPATGNTGFYDNRGHSYALDSFALGSPQTIRGFGSSPVPEPSSFALLGLGGIGLAMNAYRRRREVAV